MRYWEIIADNLSKAGWSWGCVSTINSNWQTIFVADAHRGDEKRYVLHADEKLTAVCRIRIRGSRLRSFGRKPEPATFTNYLRDLPQNKAPLV